MVLLATALAAIISTTPEPAAAASKPARVPLALSVAYFGDMIFHPGLAVGAEVTLLQKSGVSLFGAAGAGGYVHYRYATALLAEAGLGGRFTARKGFFVDLRACAGYLHQFPFGDVHSVSGDGTVGASSYAGKPAFRWSSSLGVGWDASAPAVAPLQFFFRVEAAGEVGKDRPHIFHPGVLLGVAYRLG